MRYKKEGPSLKHQKNKLNHGVFTKSIGAIMGKNILPDVELPKVKKKRPYKPRPNARKPHKQPEKELQKQIIYYLRAYGCYAGRVKVQAFQYRGSYLRDNTLMIGVPDILCFAPSGMWWIECKWGKGQLSQEQIRFKYECEKCGQKYIVARNRNDVNIIFENQQFRNPFCPRM